MSYLIADRLVHRLTECAIFATTSVWVTFCKTRCIIGARPHGEQASSRRYEIGDSIRVLVSLRVCYGNRFVGRSAERMTLSNIWGGLAGNLRRRLCLPVFCNLGRL